MIYFSSVFSGGVPEELALREPYANVDTCSLVEMLA